MLIKSYKITDSTIQADGKQRVCVAFVDYLGKIHNRGYDFPAKAIIADEIKIRQDHVVQGLKDAEIEKVIGLIEDGESFSLEYATAEEVKAIMIDRITEKEVDIDEISLAKTRLSSEVK